jgi:ATP-dependent helicase/DNAse subunit B
LCDNLALAALLARSRFESPDFGPYDGVLRHPVVTAALAERFGPAKVFSPTALEAYVSCPFRFWLEHVLRLDPLEDPVEQVEHTRRGAAFHRALARFHRWIKDTLPLDSGELPEGVSEHLLKQIGDATEEYALRAPSAAGRELWRLEGRRLMRSAARYRGHWHAFRKPWQEKSATPTPFAFEADFGVAGENVSDPLVIAVGDVEVRIGGRIDRIDTAELGSETGFWVIDYKTGRAANYSAAQVEKFEKLQLPLYALAVERVLLKDRRARPLGVAYWLVTDTGHKPMLPSRFADASKWERFRGQLEAWVATLVGRIRGGDFPLAPRSEHCTDTCGFGPVCRISQSRHTGKTFALSLPVVSNGE